MAQVHAELDLNDLSACEQEQIARQIFYPKNGYEMHVSTTYTSYYKTRSHWIVQQIIKYAAIQLGQCTEEPIETNHRELFNCKRWHSVCGR